MLWEAFGLPPTDDVIGEGRVNRNAGTTGEFLPKRIDVIAQLFIGSGLRVGRFVFEAGDREGRRAWLCNIWFLLGGFGSFWFSWGRFCRALLFRDWPFLAWVMRIGGHRNACNGCRKAYASNQAACYGKWERSVTKHDACHSVISQERPGEGQSGQGPERLSVPALALLGSIQSME